MNAIPSISGIMKSTIATSTSFSVHHSSAASGFWKGMGSQSSSLRAVRDQLQVDDVVVDDDDAHGRGPHSVGSGRMGSPAE
jgi:hypothetical protein